MHQDIAREPPQPSTTGRGEVDSVHDVTDIIAQH